MLRKIWSVLGAVALIFVWASDVGPFAGDEHPPADLAHAANEFDNHRQANPATDDMFAPGVSYAAGNGPVSVAVGDFDQDGRADLVTANPWLDDTCVDAGGGDVTVLLGHGDGTFAAGVSYAPDSRSVAVGDFDQDGRADLVTTHRCWDDVTVLLGNGDGTFADGVSYAGGGWSVAVDDLNQDGWPDLVTTRGSSVTVLLGNGDGTFAAGLSYPAGNSVLVSVRGDKAETMDWFGIFYSWSVAVGDFDQDGWPDLVTTDPWSFDVTVLLGNGDGTFAAGVSYAAGDGPVFYVAVADFDQDGWLDLVTANPVDNDLDGVLEPVPGDVRVLLGHGDGTFAAAVSYVVGVGPISVAVGDFDQDGRADLVTANGHVDPFFPPSSVTVLLGDGDGTFAAGVSYAGGGWSVAVGDFNQDGWPDLVTANPGSDEVFVLINQGGPLPISLDIKPDSFPNSVNPYSRGVIPVAILGSDTFDVAEIDVATLQFGPAGAEPTHSHRGHLQDVDLDGITDLVTHYRTRDTGIVCGDESATLTGETLDGQPIEGSDSINTVGCRASRWPAIWMKDQDRHDTQRRDGPVNIERQ